MDWASVAELADADQELPRPVTRVFRDDVVLVTPPDARGGGAYRALVRARWDAATAVGAPALVTQPRAASRPILERLEFRAMGSIDVLVDRGAVRRRRGAVRLAPI